MSQKKYFLAGLFLVSMVFIVTSEPWGRNIPAHAQVSGTTTLVSVSSAGEQGDGYSSLPYLSIDGRFVVFLSVATNLVSDDTNNMEDVFVHDRQTGITSRVSVASDGTQANNVSRGTGISADGRYVVFQSDASNLVYDDTNERQDVFLHDRQAGITTRISVASDGTQGNGDSRTPSISTDGRYIAFYSYANNLISGDANHTADFFYMIAKPETWSWFRPHQMEAREIIIQQTPTCRLMPVM